MAYLDLDNMFAAPVASRPEAVPAMATAGFSALEWSVIALARRDTLRSLTQRGRLSRAMSSLFGLGTASSLSDPRLEALRRMAAYVWQQGFALPMAEIERFRSAGFAEAQIETLVESVTGIRIGAEHRGMNMIS